MIKRCDFMKVVQIPNPKNRFLVKLRSFFSKYKFFPGHRWFFPVSKSKEDHFNEKMISLADLKKKYLFSAKVLILAIFGYLGPQKGRFPQRTGKISTNPRSVSWKRLFETLCYNLSFLSLLACEGDG